MNSTDESVLSSGQEKRIEPPQSLEGIALGMTDTLVKTGLTNAGFTLKLLFKVKENSHYTVSFKGDDIGSIDLEQDRVTRVEQLQYDSARTADADAASFADFLFWLLHDSSSPVPTKDSGFAFPARISTPIITIRDLELRRSNIKWKQLFLLAGKKHYRIDIQSYPAPLSPRVMVFAILVDKEE